MLLVLRRTAAFALVIAAALLVPSLAAAAEFEVNGTADSAETPARTACETGVGECTLRAAIADAGANSELDEITFGPTFDGGAGSTIALSSTLSISQPVEIRDSLTEVSGELVPAATVQVSGTAFLISAQETVIEGLGIEATSIGIQIFGALGAKIRDNFISGNQAVSTPQAGVEVNAVGGSDGNLIEGNRIQAPGPFAWGIAIQYGANRIFGNEIEGGGCCYQGILLELSAAGNQIGDDTAEHENVISGFWYSAIWVDTSNHNEIGRNRGASTSSGFIEAPSAVEVPTISKAHPTKVSGTSKPGAKVLVFATPGESTGEIEGFLGEATANGSGEWAAPITTSPVGAHVSAIQTFEGSTSELAATKAVESEPSSGGGGTGGGSSGGGSTSTGGSTTTSATTSVTPKPPKVTITKGPAKKSKATTAKFKFKASVAGAKFECKLDQAKWAKCSSPKTYKRLKPGVHTFQVRAIASGVTSAATKSKFTVKA